MVLPSTRHAVSRSSRVALDPYLLFTIYHSPADEDSFRQTRKHRRHRTHVARSGGCASRVAARGNRVGRGAARGGNFEGQPASGNPHRSGHEGAEALADVWGDAAGNAPAVASVTRLALRPCRRFPGTTQIISDREALRRAPPRRLRARTPARTREPLPPDEDRRSARAHA